ncbi:MAG: hypothetical protein M1840_006350 [Geoglossum simile]|nr:MAG: hypothetical protein M1840_006350 [Geoglossum simile]
MGPTKKNTPSREGPSRKSQSKIQRDTKRNDYIAKKRKLKKQKDEKTAERKKCEEALKQLLEKGENPEDADLKKQVEDLKRQLAELEGALGDISRQSTTLDEEMDIDDPEEGGAEDGEEDGARPGTQSAPIVLDSVEPWGGPSKKKGKEVAFERGIDNRRRKDEEEDLFVQDSDEESYGPPLFSRDDAATRDGIDMKVEGWKQIGYTKQYVVRYGPRNAARYRFEPASEVSIDYNEDPSEDIGNPDNRNGEKRVGKKYIYTKQHVYDIYGVAWRSAGSMEEDLDLINPDMDIDRYPNTAVLLLWIKGGKRELKWETRSALRNRWGTKNADKAIFEAAMVGEERFQEFLEGRRKAESRSPTPGVSYNTARRYREQSQELGSRSKTPARTGTKQAGVDRDALREFKESFCEIHETTVDDLTPRLAALMTEAWQSRKAEA